MLRKKEEVLDEAEEQHEDRLSGVRQSKSESSYIHDEILAELALLESFYPREFRSRIDVAVHFVHRGSVEPSELDSELFDSFLRDFLGLLDEVEQDLKDIFADLLPSELLLFLKLLLQSLKPLCDLHSVEELDDLFPGQLRIE